MDAQSARPVGRLVALPRACAPASPLFSCDHDPQQSAALVRKIPQVMVAPTDSALLSLAAQQSLSDLLPGRSAEDRLRRTRRPSQAPSVPLVQTWPEVPRRAGAEFRGSSGSSLSTRARHPGAVHRGASLRGLQDESGLPVSSRPERVIEDSSGNTLTALPRTSEPPPRSLLRRFGPGHLATLGRTGARVAVKVHRSRAHQKIEADLGLPPLTRQPPLAARSRIRALDFVTPPASWTSFFARIRIRKGARHRQEARKRAETSTGTFRGHPHGSTCRRSYWQYTRPRVLTASRGSTGNPASPTFPTYHDEPARKRRERSGTGSPRLWNDL